MLRASRIERPVAARAFGSAAEIFPDRQLKATGTAENEVLIPARLRPDLRVMTDERGMTSVAAKPVATAFEPDRHYIVLAVIMGTACFRIDPYAQDIAAENPPSIARAVRRFYLLPTHPM